MSAPKADKHMTTHMSSTEAVAQGLPGHDCYRASHLIYKDDINRDGGVIRLCLEAFYAFTDSIMIAERHAMLQEELSTKLWLAEGGSLKTERLPDTPVTWKWLRFLNLEHLKIASGFEITLKSILLERNYIIQEIDKNIGIYRELAQKQKTEPVHSGEVIEVGGYRYDGTMNYLPGLTNKSLGFEQILKKPKYRAALGLPHSDLDLINEFRNLRNEIHFPQDAIGTPIRSANPVPVSDFLLCFINNWVIDRSNLIRKKHQFGGSLLPLPA